MDQLCQFKGTMDSKPANVTEMSGFDSLHNNSANWGFNYATLTVKGSLDSIKSEDRDPIHMFSEVVLCKRQEALIQAIGTQVFESRAANFCFVQYSDETKNSVENTVRDSTKCLEPYTTSVFEDHILPTAAWGCLNLNNILMFERLDGFDLEETIKCANLQSELLDDHFV